MAPPTASPSSGRRRLVLLVLAMLLGAAPASAASEGAVTARLHVNPLVVSLELSATTIKVGGGVTARVVVRNAGTETLRDITLSVRFEPVGLSSKGATTAKLNQLKGGKSGEASVRLCGAAVGSYVILGQAEHAGVTIESPAHILVVIAGRQAKC